MGWNANDDQWARYSLQNDYSQATDVAARNPEKLAELEAEFDVQVMASHVYPIGAGLYPLHNPAARIAISQNEWHFSDRTKRLPEFAAPNLRNQNNWVRWRPSCRPTPAVCCTPWAVSAAV